MLINNIRVQESLCLKSSDKYFIIEKIIIEVN